MRHQNKLQKTRMLIDAVEHYIYTMEGAASPRWVNQYQELLKELEEEKSQLERTIGRNL